MSSGICDAFPNILSCADVTRGRLWQTLARSGDLEVRSLWPVSSRSSADILGMESKFTYNLDHRTLERPTCEPASYTFLHPSETLSGSASH